MVRRGLDYAAGRPSGASIRAAGYTFVCRYLSDGGPDLPGKQLLPSERADLHANGVDIVLNWETTGTTARGGYSAGVADANAAVAQGVILGSPVGTVVYFSCDWQVRGAQTDAVVDYFRGVNSVIGVDATGAYGDADILRHLRDAGVISWRWQTQAWSAGAQDPGINILQDNNAGYVTVGGIQCDLDLALTDNFGQWAAPKGTNVGIPAQNVGDVDAAFDARLLDPYVYGGDYDANPRDGADCSYVVSWVLRGYLYGLAGFDWLTHPVSTESWPYDYSTDTPAAPGTIGPYGTVAIASPDDQPADSALLICIMHRGGGEDSHMNCLTGPAITPTPLAAPAGKIMESNGDAGTCTNGDGGTPADSDIWTDWWYLPGPITGGYTPPPAPVPGTTYTVIAGDTLGAIAARFGVTLGAIEHANPQITDPNLIDVGQTINIPGSTE
ncbi:MAG: DUF1906 domain-containing protein [Corynebacterium sp.]|nr:DUF1906 domain-containing protein [Corynebacterium sp.]